MSTAPDQDFLYLCIDAGYKTLNSYPDHAEFIYLLLSVIDEVSYEWQSTILGYCVNSGSMKINKN